MKPLAAPSYDWFKTIVAVVLGILLLLMLLRGCAVNPAAPAPTSPTQIATETLVPAPLAAETNALPEVAQTSTPSAVPTEIEPTATPTAAAPTEPPATEATEPPTAAPEEPTPTPAAPEASCTTLMPSRLSVGQTARVVQRLNMRQEASLNAPILQTNATNTQVEIIGGPVCTPVGGHAYQWWQIRLADGAEGWSAESPLNESTYFLEPVP
jgi:hypothetical protein